MSHLTATTGPIDQARLLGDLLLAVHDRRYADSLQAMVRATDQRSSVKLIHDLALMVDQLGTQMHGERWRDVLALSLHEVDGEEIEAAALNNDDDDDAES